LVVLWYLLLAWFLYGRSGNPWRSTSGL